MVTLCSPAIPPTPAPVSPVIQSAARAGTRSSQRLAPPRVAAVNEVTPAFEQRGQRRRVRSLVDVEAQQAPHGTAERLGAHGRRSSRHHTTASQPKVRRPRERAEGRVGDPATTARRSASPRRRLQRVERAGATRVP